MATMKKALVLSNVKFFDFIRKELSAAGYEVESLAGKDFPGSYAEMESVEILVVTLEKVTKELMEKLPKLKVVSRLGVGLDNIDIPEATRRGVAVINIPDYCVEEVASQACSFILAANRKIVQANGMVKNGKWTEWMKLIPIIPLSETTVGLIGMGRIGEKVASYLRAFGCKILVYDPYASGSPGENTTRVSLPELLAGADIITIHCPLTEETRNIIDVKAVKLMTRKPVMVNTSRGGIIDESALKDALDDGSVSFAFLDVLETEPPRNDHPLINHPKAFITSHNGWYSESSQARQGRLAVERIIDYLEGRHVPSLVNKEVLGKRSKR